MGSFSLEVATFSASCPSPLPVSLFAVGMAEEKVTVSLCFCFGWQLVNPSELDRVCPGPRAEYELISCTTSSILISPSEILGCWDSASFLRCARTTSARLPFEFLGETS